METHIHKSCTLYERQGERDIVQTEIKFRRFMIVSSKNNDRFDI